MFHKLQKKRFYSFRRGFLKNFVFFYSFEIKIVISDTISVNDFDIVRKSKDNSKISQRDGTNQINALKRI